MITLHINGKTQQIDVEPDMPLLWVLRDELALTGTKYGCGIALCGSCTVHVDGAAVRSCVTPVGQVAGKRITTIEALASGETPHPVQQAWLDVEVPQCGYCQPGIIMSIADLLAKNTDPTDTQIDEALTHICRCSTYARIRPAVHAAAKTLRGNRKA